ncbi:MAG: carboxypeptidase-like regulatory domain-containing protein [Candidatus Wallbacteria bacterium]
MISSTNRRLSASLLAIFGFLFFIIAVTIGCGGGGGGSQSSSVIDSGPTVSVIEGYIYVPATTNAAPKVNSGRLISPSLTTPAEVAVTKSAAVNTAVLKAGEIPTTTGYVPLSDAIVILSGTNKAVKTDVRGYYRFEVGQNETSYLGQKKLIISKSESNVNVELDVNVTVNENRLIIVEVNTNTGDKYIREKLTNKVQVPFVYLSGKVSSATGSLISGAQVKAYNGTITRTATTDSNGYYQFTDLTAGSFTIEVSKANFETASKNVEVSSGYSVTNINFSLKGTFTITAPEYVTEVSKVTIKFATSVPSTCLIDYGINTSYGSTVTTTSLITTQEIVLNNLSPKTIYHFKITATDQYLNRVTSTDYNFETLDPNSVSNKPPSISSNYTYRKTHNSITVTFSTNTTAYGQLSYSTTSDPTVVKYPSDGSEIGPRTSFEITVPDLTPGQTYKVYIIAKNNLNKNLTSTEGPLTITTDLSPDTSAPVITIPAASSIKAKEATITWNATDDRSGTNGRIYYGNISIPTLTYDSTYNPPRPKFTYAKVSDIVQAELSNDPKVVKLTGLDPNKTYYYRAASEDASGNIGTTMECSFKTATPGTQLNFSIAADNPAASQISPGQNSNIWRLKIDGSTEEIVTISKITFTQTGTIPYNGIKTFTVTDGVNTWTASNVVSSDIAINFDSPKLVIPKGSSIYLNINVLLNELAINKNVQFKISSSSMITATGDVYSSDTPGNVQENIYLNVGALSAFTSNAHSVGIGSLDLSGTSADPNSAKPVNFGQKDVGLLTFDLKSNYEDIDVVKIQISQIASAIIGSDKMANSQKDYSTLRLYDGINSIAVGEVSGTSIIFQSQTKLLKIAKGSSKTLSIVADIQAGATGGNYVKLQVENSYVEGKGTYSGMPVTVNYVAPNANPIAGLTHIIGDTSLIAALSNDSPVSQIFKEGDQDKTFTVITLTAGSSEDLKINSLKLDFQGGTVFGNTDIKIRDEQNNTLPLTGSFSATTYTATETTAGAGIVTVPKSSSKKLYVSGNINSGNVSKTIKVSLLNAQTDITATGSRTAAALTADQKSGEAVGYQHSIVGQVALSAVTPQTLGDVLVGAQAVTFLKFRIIATGEDVNVKNLNFKFTGNYSALENLKVINADTSKEIAINPTLSSTLNFSISNYSADTLISKSSAAGVTFWLVGNISSSAVAGNNAKFSILADGISVQSSTQIYKTSETVEGNTLSVIQEYIKLSTDTTIPIAGTAVIGSASDVPLLSFKLDANTNNNYNVSKIIVKQYGSATLGAGQDIDNFKFKTGAGLTEKAATITVSRTTTQTSLTIDFGSSPLLITSTGSTICTITGNVQANANSGSTVKLYTDSTLLTAVGAVSGKTLTGTGSITGQEIGFVNGALSVKLSSTNPAASNILDGNLKQFMKFDIIADSVEDIIINEMKISLTGSLLDIDPTSVQIDTTAPVTINAPNNSSKIFTITPAGNQITITKNNYLTITLSAKANYSSAPSGNELSFGIENINDITGRGATSQKTIKSTGTAFGNKMTISKGADTTKPNIVNITGTPAEIYSENNKIKRNIIISWQTDNKLCDSNEIKLGYTSGGPYDLTYNNSNSTISVNKNTNAYSLKISGTDYDKAVYYIVGSTDSKGNFAYSAEQTVAADSAKPGSLSVEVASTMPAAAIYPAKSRQLVGVFSLVNTKDATHNDSVKISSIKLNRDTTVTKPLSLSAISKVEIVMKDSLNTTYSVTNPTTDAMTFTNLNYSIAPPAGNGTNKLNFEVYVTANALFTGEVRLKTTPGSDITAVSALYQSTVTATPASALSTNIATFDIGRLTLENDSPSSNTPASTISKSRGTSDITVLGFSLKNDRSASAADSVENVIISSLKITNKGTGVVDSEISNLRLLDESNTVITSGKAGSGEYIFEQMQLVIGKGTTKNFKVLGDIPSNAAGQKTLQFELKPSNITAKTAESGTLPVTISSQASIQGTKYLIGSNTLSVKLDSSTPAISNFTPDDTEKLFAVFSVTASEGEDIDVNSCKFNLSGTATDTGDLINMRLLDDENGAYHTLAHAAGVYSTSDTIAFSASQTRKFKLYGTANSTGTANRTVKFKLDTTNCIQGTGKLSSATISTSDTVESNALTTIGTLNTLAEATTPSGNILIGDTNSGNGVALFKFNVKPTFENAKVNSIKITMNNGSLTTDIDSTSVKLRRSSDNAALSCTVSTSASDNSITFTNNGDADLNNLAKGVSFGITLTANISTGSTAGNTVSFNIKNASDISATGVTSTKTLTVSGTAAGNNLTTVQGTIAVSDAKTVDTKEIIIGSANTLAAIVKIAASNEAVNISEIKADIEGADFSSDFDSATPFGFKLTKIGSTTPLAATVARSGNTLTFAIAPAVNIAAGANDTILIEGNPLKATAVAGHKCKVTVQSGMVKATGVTSSKTITSTGSINYNTGTLQELITGKLTASVDSSSPTTKTILKGKTTETLAIFKISSDVSSNSNEIENITLTKAKVNVSGSTSDFSNLVLKIGANSYSPASSASAEGNTTDYTFDLSAPVVTISKTSGSNFILASVVADVAAGTSLTGVTAKLLKSGMEGTGVTSGRTITNSSNDQLGATHSISTAGFTASINASQNQASTTFKGPFASYTAPTDQKVMAVDLTADSKDDINVNKLILKFNGSSAISSKITKIVVKDSTATALATSNSPVFDSNGNTTINFTSNLNIPKSTTKYVTIHIDMSSIDTGNDNSSFYFTVENGGFSAQSVTASQTVTSANTVTSNTHYYKESSVQFLSSSTYTAADYYRGDTAKTVFEFKMAAGAYSDVRVNKIVLESGTGSTANLSSDITNVSLIYGGTTYSNGVNGCTVTAAAGKITFALPDALNITIPASSITNTSQAKIFKFVADISSTVTNGIITTIKANSAHADYASGDFDAIVDSSNVANKSGIINGNTHNLYAVGSLTISNANGFTPLFYGTDKPMWAGITATSNSTQSNIDNCTIGVFLIKVGNYANVNLDKIILKNIGSSTDLKLDATHKIVATMHEDYNKLFYDSYAVNESAQFRFGGLSTDSLSSKLEGSIITLTPKTSAPASSYTLTAGKTYYMAVKANLKNPPVSVGKSIKLFADTQDTSYPALTASAASGTLKQITYSGVVTGTERTVQAPTITVTPTSEDFDILPYQLSWKNALYQRPIGKITISNNKFSDFVLNHIKFSIYMDDSSAVDLSKYITNVQLIENGTIIKTITASNPTNIKTLHQSVDIDFDTTGVCIWPTGKNGIIKSGETRTFKVVINTLPLANTDGTTGTEGKSFSTNKLSKNINDPTLKIPQIYWGFGLGAAYNVNGIFKDPDGTSADITASDGSGYTHIPYSSTGPKQFTFFNIE